MTPEQGSGAASGAAEMSDVVNGCSFTTSVSTSLKISAASSSRKDHTESAQGTKEEVIDAGNGVAVDVELDAQHDEDVHRASGGAANGEGGGAALSVVDHLWSAYERARDVAPFAYLSRVHEESIRRLGLESLLTSDLYTTNLLQSRGLNQLQEAVSTKKR